MPSHATCNISHVRSVDKSLEEFALQFAALLRPGLCVKENVCEIVSLCVRIVSHTEESVSHTEESVSLVSLDRPICNTLPHITRGHFLIITQGHNFTAHISRP